MAESGLDKVGPVQDDEEGRTVFLPDPAFHAEPAVAGKPPHPRLTFGKLS